MRINDVECDPHWTYIDGERTRLLVPRKVRDLDFFDFAVSCFAEQCSDYEKAAFEASTSIMLYYALCHRYLLHRRTFDLSSFSSLFYPSLRELCGVAKVKSTGDLVLDNIQALIQLGRPDGPTNLEEIMRTATYRHPHWIPLGNDDEDIDRLVDRGLEHFKKTAWPRITEVDEPLEKAFGEIRDRFLALILFVAEKQTFEVLHRGAEAVYEMIKEKLSASQKALFKIYCLKNPEHMNRVLWFDPSLVVPGWVRMIEKIAREVDPEKVGLFLTPERIPVMWLSYLNFYPSWLRYVQDDEQDKRDRSRKKVRYEPWLDAFTKEGPDHTVDPLRVAASELSSPSSEGSQRGPTNRRKRRGRRVGSPLPESWREIVRLEEEGVSDKEIARIIGHSPYCIWKQRKKIGKVFRNTWEGRVYRPFLWWRVYRPIEKLYNEVSSDARPRVTDFYTGIIKECIQRFYKNSQFDPKQLEKDLTPPLFRKMTLPHT